MGRIQQHRQNNVLMFHFRKSFLAHYDILMRVLDELNRELVVF